MWQISRQKALLSGDMNKIVYPPMRQKNIASIIDHSLLRPDATHTELKECCEEAQQVGFYSVCVHPSFVRRAREFLKDTNVKITSVIGFPHGMTLTEEKVYEAMHASLDGADELDVVINIGALKSGDWETVRKDIMDVIVATKGLIHKTIIETCYLDKDEKVKVVEIALDAGAEFIKTSTGFGPCGARVEDVRLIKKIVGDKAGIKAAGGIRTLEHVLDLLKAGATRIGSSAGVKIVKEWKKYKKDPMGFKNINIGKGERN